MMIQNKFMNCNDLLKIEMVSDKYLLDILVFVGSLITIIQSSKVYLYISFSTYK